jgi:hypothetical protein
MKGCCGEGYDWRNAPIDAAAVHATGGGWLMDGI